jgi:hypothetical protein
VLNAWLLNSKKPKLKQRQAKIKFFAVPTHFPSFGMRISDFSN